MPGHSSLLCADYVNLSALPGIHVFLSCFIESSGDVDGRDKPGHDERIFINTSFTIMARPPCFARKIRARKKSSQIINLKN
jgi:hypothetical protein